MAPLSSALDVVHTVQCVICDACLLLLVHVGLYPVCAQDMCERQTESVSQESVDGSQ